MSIDIRTSTGANGWLRAMLVAVVVCQAAGTSSRVTAQAGTQSDDALTVVEVQPNFYMIAGAGSNVGVHIGADGVVVDRHRPC